MKQSISRRSFLQSLALLGGIGSIQMLAAAAEASKEAQRQEDPHAQIAHGAEKIVILIYPGFTAIDAIGPEYILSGMMGASVQFIAKDKSPIACETRFKVIPDLDFSECPEEPDLILVPGATEGLLKAIDDSETLGFLRERGTKAKMIGSVCTGSILLGAAGLLNGYEATSHWQTMSLLPLVGAKPKNERVVIDRNRITGAGVTAGLDLAFQLVQRYRGDFYAKGMQLLAQYDPQEIFPGGGDPKTADKDVVMLLDQLHSPFVDLMASKLKEKAMQP